MKTTLSHRSFLAATGGMAIAFAVPCASMALSETLASQATTRTLDIDGGTTTVFGLINGNRVTGPTLDPGQRFPLDPTNNVVEPEIIDSHWQVPPIARDGVPDLPMPVLQAGESGVYDLKAAAGRHWMHSDVPIQEVHLLTASPIVRLREDLGAEVPMILGMSDEAAEWMLHCHHMPHLASGMMTTFAVSA